MGAQVAPPERCMWQLRSALPAPARQLGLAQPADRSHFGRELAHLLIIPSLCCARACRQGQFGAGRTLEGRGPSNAPLRVSSLVAWFASDPGRLGVEGRAAHCTRHGPAAVERRMAPLCAASHQGHLPKPIGPSAGGIELPRGSPPPLLPPHLAHTAKRMSLLLPFQFMQMACTAALVARGGSGAGRLGNLLALLVLVLALPHAHGQALGLDRKAKEATTKRFLKQLADLNLWAGVVACSDGAGDAVYKVRACRSTTTGGGGAGAKRTAAPAAGSWAPSRPSLLRQLLAAADLS